MLLICSSTYFASFGYFLAYHRARRLESGHGTRAGHVCSHLIRAYTRLDLFLILWHIQVGKLERSVARV